MSGAQLFVQSGPKVDNGGEGAQWPSCTGVSSCWLVILIGTGSSEVGAQSPVGRKWGCSVSSASRSLRAHKVALDGRWPSLPWGVRGCIARHHRERAHAGRMQAGRAQRATWAQATRSRGETSAGPKQAGGGGSTLCSRHSRHWGAVGGYCTAGESRAAP